MDLDIDVGPCDLTMDHLIPLALIMNEMISNSLKYAFEEVDSGKITIRLRQKESDLIHLSFSDNGKGLDDMNEWENPSGLGFELIQILTEQLSGEIDLDIENGVNFELKFKKA